jgi:hypothetical protein
LAAYGRKYFCGAMQPVGRGRCVDVLVDGEKIRTFAAIKKFVNNIL